MQNIGQNLVEWYRGLPEKKKYVEFVTAVLSVPVMLTVIIINLNNLNQQKATMQKQQAPQEKTTPIQIVITGDKSNTIPFEPSPTTALTPQVSLSPSPTSKACIKEVGQVSISSPRESEVITKNPVCITIATQSDYCGVELSYKLNTDVWSDYSDKSICLYNLSNGNHTIQVKVKSTKSNDETTLQRSFVYQGATIPTVQPTTASTSAGM